MTEHRLQRRLTIDQKEGRVGTATPSCTCGWTGETVDATEKEWVYKVIEQENKHLEEQDNE